MGAFTITTMFAFPIGLGTLVMGGANPEVDGAKIAKLRQDAGLDENYGKNLTWRVPSSRSDVVLGRSC